MRLAILSDIHSNLDALTAVLEDIDTRGVDEVVCLGDIVGYGAEPRECVALLRERVSFAVLGNHDAAVVDRTEREFFNAHARTAIHWTAQRLDEHSRAWLASLPYRVSRDGLLFVHSAPRNPEGWEYIFGGFEARRHGKYFYERVCFVGHTHVPAVFALDHDGVAYDATHRFLINVGSVGQPRDEDPRACYGLLDTVAGSFEHLRVEYDVSSAMRKILAEGLPRRLAERLAAGT